MTSRSQTAYADDILNVIARLRSGDMDKALEILTQLEDEIRYDHDCGEHSQCEEEHVHGEGHDCSEHCDEEHVIDHDCSDDCEREHYEDQGFGDIRIVADKWLARYGYYATGPEDKWTMEMRECMIAIVYAAEDPLRAQVIMSRVSSYANTR